jgi:hypothetical protein
MVSMVANASRKVGVGNERKNGGMGEGGRKRGGEEEWEKKTEGGSERV